MGYEVDAVDVSDLAIRGLVEETEPLLTIRMIRNVHLHLDDVFGAEFWRKLGLGRFDVIYDRQGISAVNPRDREDYAFLLRRALKPEGVIVLEGNYRTPHVRGNKSRGPPFDLSEAELKRLFPEHDGFEVKCKDLPDEFLKDFGPEVRVTGKVYKEHWATQFPCVAYRLPEAEVLEGRKSVPNIVFSVPEHEKPFKGVPYRQGLH